METAVNLEEHRRVMLAHCVKLAELDMAYARWAAKRYAAESRACWRICRSCSPTR